MNNTSLTPPCGCCVLFWAPERPVNADQQERTLLKGVFSVRKGKSQLHKWAERQVILCGTCLIVASVKDSLTGKMHILPLVGGKVSGHFSWRSFNLLHLTANPLLLMMVQLQLSQLEQVFFTAKGNKKKSQYVLSWSHDVSLHLSLYASAPPVT